MTSIFISSDALDQGVAVARKVAEQLNATFVGRDILPAIAKERRISEADLLSLLDFNGKFGLYQKRLLMCLESSVASRIRDDNVVCTGLGAHLYIRGVSHILNVRVLTDMASLTFRTAAEKNISPSRVRKGLEKRMRKRRRWTLNAFQVDETQPSNYDMLFTLGNFDIDRVAKTVAETAGDRKFTAMTYSRKILDEQVLACNVRLALVKKYPEVMVRIKDDTAFLTIAKRWGWRRKAEAIKRIASEVDGVNYVRIALLGEDKSQIEERVVDVA